MRPPEPTTDVFGGRMPAAAGDLAVESRGIAPIPATSRYGSPWRLFTVWFAPNLTMTGVFAGTLGATFGLGLRTGLVAIVAGTLLGAIAPAYLSTWGPRTGAAQLRLARLPFGAAVALPGAIQWLSSIAWDALVGLFGGEAVSVLLHIPFPVAVAAVLALQAAVGILGYEAVHRLETVMTVVLGLAFAVITVRLLGGGITGAADTVHGADRLGAFLLFSTVSLSTAISWAPYAADYSRYLPASSSRWATFGFTLAGLTCAYVWVEALGLAAAHTLADQTADGVRQLLGGGVVGAIGLAAIGVAAISSNAMNDYSGSLALQTVGVRLRRPVTAVIVVVLAYLLILWLHGGDLATKFTNVLLLVGYWIPPFLGVVVVDWLLRRRGGAAVDPLTATTGRWGATIAVTAFAAGIAASVPFMSTTLVTGAVATALHGGDLAYYVGFVATVLVYTPLRLLADRRR